MLEEGDCEDHKNSSTNLYLQIFLTVKAALKLNLFFCDPPAKETSSKKSAYELWANSLLQYWENTFLQLIISQSKWTQALFWCNNWAEFNTKLLSVSVIALGTDRQSIVTGEHLSTSAFPKCLLIVLHRSLFYINCNRVNTGRLNIYSQYTQVCLHTTTWRRLARTVVH